MAIARFSVAVDRPKQNGKEATSDFPNCIAFGKTAELIEKYLAKGRLVGITGRLQTGSYTDKDGKKVYTTDVVADRVEFLDRAGEGELTPSRGTENKSKNLTPAEEAYVQETLTGFSKLNADDIPFGG
jgi:single-strand DNA-binding protein